MMIATLLQIGSVINDEVILEYMRSAGCNEDQLFGFLQCNAHLHYKDPKYNEWSTFLANEYFEQIGLLLRVKYDDTCISHKDWAIVAL